MHACRRRAWISGHPLGKAPTVDRTGPGMAWHGVAECLLPLALLSISAGPRDWVSWRGGESEITNASCQGLRQHIILQARRRSRRSEQQPRSPTRALTHAWRYRQCQPQTQTRHAGLASSLSMGPSDVQHGRGLQVITFSLTLSLSMPAGSACERSDKPPAAPVRRSPVNSILRLL
jgi:hypothetical protein